VCNGPIYVLLPSVNTYIGVAAVWLLAEGRKELLKGAA